MSSLQHALRRAGLEPRRRRSDGRERREASKVTLPGAYFGVDGESRRYLLPSFVARKTMDPLARQLGHAKLTTGQMRRFFNHCRQIERRLKTDGESWERVCASFRLLGAHAQNAQSKGNIPAQFREFVEDNIQRVVDDNNQREAFLHGFLPHFEALVGFAARHLRPGT